MLRVIFCTVPSRIRSFHPNFTPSRLVPPYRPRDTHKVRVCTYLCGAAVVEVDPTPSLEHHLHLLQYVILCVATADDILPERDELLPPVCSEDPKEAQPL